MCLLYLATYFTCREIAKKIKQGHTPVILSTQKAEIGGSWPGRKCETVSEKQTEKQKGSQVLVAHISNPSYSGSRDHEDPGS
jgi:hypothetical protein